MVILVAPWELGHDTPLREARMWEAVGKSYSVDGVRFAPVTGIVPSYGGLVWDRLSEYARLEDALYEDLPRVIIDEQGEEMLVDFAHPPSCYYIFGKSGQSSLYLKRPQDCSVRFGVRAEVSSLWGHQAAAIVLHDRYSKSWP